METMDEDDRVLAGKIGLALSTTLWLICSWRLVHHFCCHRRRPENASMMHDFSGDHHDITASRCRLWTKIRRWMTRRRTFHGLLWIATLCDMISYADLSQLVPFTIDRSLAENLGFILLNVVGRVTELLGCITVTLIWLRTLANANRRSIEASQQGLWLSSLSSVFVVFTLMLVMVSVSLSLVVFLRFPRASRDEVLNTPLSVLQTLLEAVCWGIHGIIAALCVTMITHLILRMVSGSEWKRRLLLLSKAVLPMAIACLGYFSRCVWLMIAYISGGEIRDTWAWWIAFVWVPSFAVTLALLYSVRKRDTFDHLADYQQHNHNDDSENSGSDDLERPLLSQPPEEAFRAFSRLREQLHGNDDDTCDDSLILASPTPHVFMRHAVSETCEDIEESKDAETDDVASALSTDD